MKWHEAGESQMKRVLASLAAAMSLVTNTAMAEVTQIDNGKLEALIASGIPVIDIRTQGEWKDTGVLEDSHLVTFFDEQGGYDVNTWMQRLATIADPDEPVVLICWTGQRSHVVSDFLDNQGGYTRVHNVTRGLADWLNTSRPVTGI